MKGNAISSRKRVTIGLLWHSLTSNNLGVGALTESQIAICLAAGEQACVDVDFILFGTTGGSDYFPLGVPIRKGSTASIKQILFGNFTFLNELDQCDLVLDIGEGDSFTDIYGLKRFVAFFLSKLIVLAKRKTLILSPQTIGPFDYWFTRTLAAAIMKRCKRVYARDGQSMAYLESLGVSDNTAEAIDVAFRLPYRCPERESNEQVRIGINISGLLYAGGYTRNNQFSLTLDYRSLIRDLLNELTKDPGNQVWLIPHVATDLNPVEDDRVAIDAFAKEFPNVICAPSFKSPSDAKSFISGMDFMTGGRMHACIAAFSSGVPVVPLAYSRKFNGLFASLNYQWVADGKTMNNQEAFKLIMQGFRERDLLATQIKEGIKIAEKYLQNYEQYTSFCIASHDCPVKKNGQSLKSLSDFNIR